MVSRRKFIGALICSSGLCSSDLANQLLATTLSPELSAPTDRSLSQQQQRRNKAIDRAALVSRHHPTLRKLDPLSPLTLGNGEFAFTADITGLQTFPQEYDKAMPLCTMSQWGWHTSPLPAGLDPKAFRLTQYDTHGRSVGYRTNGEGQTDLYNWLRENPHRLHLGRIGLRLLRTDHREALVTDISDVEQTLELWSGSITSRFQLQAVPVIVRTTVHPDLDLLAVTIESKLIEQGRLAVRVAFPFGSPDMQAADWNQPGRHQTTAVRGRGERVEFRRALDRDEYFAAIDYAGRAEFATESAHTFLLRPAMENARLEFVVVFRRHAVEKSMPNVPAT